MHSSQVVPSKVYPGKHLAHLIAVSEIHSQESQLSLAFAKSHLPVAVFKVKPVAHKVQDSGTVFPSRFAIH